MVSLRLETTDWREGAVCLGPNSKYFYAPLDRIETPEEKSRRELQAKFICSTCVAMTECHEFAVRTNQVIGVWAGESEIERLRRNDPQAVVLTRREEEFTL